jgi:hypothetical protein
MEGNEWETGKLQSSKEVQGAYSDDDLAMV